MEKNGKIYCDICGAEIDLNTEILGDPKRYCMCKACLIDELNTKGTGPRPINKENS